MVEAGKGVREERKNQYQHQHNPRKPQPRTTHVTVESRARHSDAPLKKNPQTNQTEIVRKGRSKQPAAVPSNVRNAAATRSVSLDHTPRSPTNAHPRESARVRALRGWFPPKSQRDSQHRDEALDLKVSETPTIQKKVLTPKSARVRLLTHRPPVLVKREPLLLQKV